MNQGGAQRPVLFRHRPLSTTRGRRYSPAMRLDAHPMLVAVALGLLGPAALETEDEERTLSDVVDAAPVGRSPVAEAPCAEAPAACEPAPAR